MIGKLDGVIPVSVIRPKGNFSIKLLIFLKQNLKNVRSCTTNNEESYLHWFVRMDKQWKFKYTSKRYYQ